MDGHHILALLAEAIPGLIAQLEVESPEKINSTFGQEVATFGQRRLAIAELLKDIVLLESDSLKELLVPAYKQLYELSSKVFPHNSFLNGIVESMFSYLFKTALSKQPNGVGI